MSVAFYSLSFMPVLTDQILRDWWMILIPAGLVFLAIAAYVGVWGILALLHAIRAHAENITVGEAFGRAREHIWRYLWIGVLSAALLFGALFIAILLPGLILFTLSLLSPDSSGAIVPFGFLIAVIIAVIIGFCVTVYYGILLSFSQWVVVEGKERGIGVLLESKHLVQKRWWGILWRMSLAMFVIMLVIGIPGAIFSAMATYWVISGTVLIMLWTQFQSLVITPIIYGSVFTLYDAVRARQAVSVDAHKGKNLFKTYIGVGFVILVLAPIAFVVGMFLSSQSPSSPSPIDLRNLFSARSEVGPYISGVSDGIATFAPALTAFIPHLPRE